MPPEVACSSKLFTNQPYLSNNQKCKCGINSLDNLLCSMATQLCCHLKLNSVATLVLDGCSLFLRQVEYAHYFLLSFILGNNSSSIHS